jgi:hypothetical protein
MGRNGLDGGQVGKGNDVLQLGFHRHSSQLIHEDRLPDEPGHGDAQGNGSPLYDVRGVLFGSFSSALAYAKGMLSLVSTPANEYTKDVGLANDMDIGSVIRCDGENMVCYGLGYTQEQKTVKVGRQVGGIEATLRGMSRRIDAVEKIIL